MACGNTGGRCDQDASFAWVCFYLFPQTYALCTHCTHCTHCARAHQPTHCTQLPTPHSYTHVGRPIQVPSAEQRAAIITGSLALQHKQAQQATQHGDGGNEKLDGNEKLAADLLQWLTPIATIGTPAMSNLSSMVKKQYGSMVKKEYGSTIKTQYAPSSSQQETWEKGNPSTFKNAGGSHVHSVSEEEEEEEAGLLVQLQAALDGYTQAMEEIKVRGVCKKHLVYTCCLSLTLCTRCGAIQMLTTCPHSMVWMNTWRGRMQRHWQPSCCSSRCSKKQHGCKTKTRMMNTC